MKGIVFSGKLQTAQLLRIWILLHRLGTPQDPGETQYENPYVTVIVVTLSETHYNRVSQNIDPELLGRSQPTEFESLGVRIRISRIRNLHLYQASQVILVNPKVREPLDNRVTYSESIFLSTIKIIYIHSRPEENIGKGKSLLPSHPNLKVLGLGSISFQPFFFAYT